MPRGFCALLRRKSVHRHLSRCLEYDVNFVYACVGAFDRLGGSCERALEYGFNVGATSRSQALSEIRLVRSRDLGVPFGAVFTWVISADIFQPFAQRAPVSYGRRPGRRQYSFILDGDQEL